MEKNKTLIIFTDSGDTIIDEGSQVYDAQEPGIVSRAEFIENAGEILQQLHEEGYTVALVADGEEASFQNVYRKNGLRSCDAWVVSETVGQQKPEAIMFQTAMEQLGLEGKSINYSTVSGYWTGEVIPFMTEIRSKRLFISNKRRNIPIRISAFAVPAGM